MIKCPECQGTSHMRCHELKRSQYDDEVAVEDFACHDCGEQFEVRYELVYVESVAA